MKKLLYLGVLVVIVVFLFPLFNKSEIVVVSPKKGQDVSSPIELRGKARGPWYFEASAPIKLTDLDGNILAQSYVMADGEWMTTEFVDFKGTLSYESPYKGEALLVFMNDNPSGDPSRDKSLSIPVVLR